MNIGALFLGAAAIGFAVILFSFSVSPSVSANSGSSGRLPAVSFRIDPASSKFMVHAHRGGLAWFKGHDHYIAVRDFSGQVEMALDVLNPASLTMTIRADSLEETGANFTPPQKDIIKKELNELVLESAKYPEITFRSTDVKVGMKNGKFEVKIGGDITLHGVTKHIVIPATVTATQDSLNAVGEFELDRSDFNVKATSAFHGMVRVKDKLTFTFDITARRA